MEYGESMCIPTNMFRARPRTRQLGSRGKVTRSLDVSTMPVSLKIDCQEPRYQYYSGNIYGFARKQLYNHYAKGFVKHVKQIYEPLPDIKLAALPPRAHLSSQAHVPGRFFQKQSKLFRDTNDIGSSRATTASNLPIDQMSNKRVPVGMLPSRGVISSKLHSRSPKRNDETPVSEVSTVNNDIYCINWKDLSCYNIHTPTTDFYSDYYSIGRLPLRSRKPNIRKSKSVNVAMLLKGRPKELHSRMDDNMAFTL